MTRCRSVVSIKSMKKQKGIVVILFTLIFVIIVGMIGLAIDTGYGYLNYRRAQTAVDAAALAGAYERFNGNINSINSSALSSANSHGYVHGTNNISITVNSPPASGFYNGDDFSVEVIIQNNLPTLLLGFFGIDFFNYSVRAVANGNIANGLNCVYVLSPNKEKAMEVSSDSSLDTNCGVHVNSSDSEGLSVESDACVRGSSITVVGGAKKDGRCDKNSDDGFDCSESGTCPFEGKPLSDSEKPIRLTDPFVGLATPSVNYSNSACPGNGGGKNVCDSSKDSCRGEKDGSRYKPYEIDTGGSKVISPGLYCGGIYIKKGNVTMNPGTYIMRGGGFVVDGSSSSVTGNGISIFNTCESSCSGSESDSQDFWPFEVKSGGTIDLSAPDCTGYGGIVCSGLEGVLFFSDRNAPSSDNPGDYPDNRIDSSSTANISGSFYTWNQHLKFHSGSSGTVSNVILVSKFLEISSGSTVGISSYSSSSKGSPVKRVTLVE